jgi:hypothetical protein
MAPQPNANNPWQDHPFQILASIAAKQWSSCMLYRKEADPPQVLAPNISFTPPEGSMSG